MMEPCCWGNYTQHRDASENLKVIDEIHNHSAVYNFKEATNSYIKKKMQEIWVLLEHPQRSIVSRVSLINRQPRLQGFFAFLSKKDIGNDVDQ